MTVRRRGAGVFGNGVFRNGRSEPFFTSGSAEAPKSIWLICRPMRHHKDPVIRYLYRIAETLPLVRQSVVHGVTSRAAEAVALIDIDQQTNATNWKDRRAAELRTSEIISVELSSFT